MWNATVGGLGANGVQFFEVTPLEINPYDGMPTYIPAYYHAEDVVAVYGKPFLGPLPCLYLESALWNAGFVQWPNIGKMDFTPQYFEDLILTLEVTNGRQSEVETFPISVVNYPVENYPPVIEKAEPRVFYVGQLSTYAVGVSDPDCMIFSRSPIPATTHTPATFGQFRQDMDSITWQMTLSGLPSYQYGPWIESLINSCNGLISFTPQFEGAYETILVATDSRGGIGIQDFPIFAVNQGTWLNHPPIILDEWHSPQVVRAGEELILTEPKWEVIDPDGDEIYYACNIGSCGFTSDGKFMWTFQSNFPGTYQVEIIAYDIRGGYGIAHVLVEVKPWWSY
jgi:hypothetical protein